MNHLRHFKIQRRQNLRHFFDQCYFYPAFGKIFRHFNADKSASNDDRCGGMLLFDIGIDFIGVGDIPQGKKVRRLFQTRNRWLDRFCPGGQDQYIERFGIGSICLGIAYRHEFFHLVHFDDLVKVTDI